MTFVDKACTRCGAWMTGVGNRALWCSECRPTVKAERAERLAAERAARALDDQRRTAAARAHAAALDSDRHQSGCWDCGGAVDRPTAIRCDSCVDRRHAMRLRAADVGRGESPLGVDPPHGAKFTPSMHAQGLAEIEASAKALHWQGPRRGMVGLVEYDLGLEGGTFACRRCRYSASMLGPWAAYLGRSHSDWHEFKAGRA